jgi:hypothetical protein
MYLTIAGSKADPITKTLFEQALGYPFNYKSLDWWDPRPGAAGRLADPDAQYPSLKSRRPFYATAEPARARF